MTGSVFGCGPRKLAPTGLAYDRAPAYLGGMRDYLARFNMLRAARDFRQFVVTRKRYEWWFMLASLASCVVIATAFFYDSYVETPWKRPEIIWVQDWRLDRTDAEIVAQQKIDQAKKEAEDARIKKLRDANAKKYQDMKDKYGGWL